MSQTTTPTKPEGARASGAGAALSIRNLCKRYGDTVAVDGVSMDIHGGEFVTLLGPSGSGKTTTLNMIAGFTDASAGEIVLDGQPIDDLPTHKRDLGVVFQHYALFPHLTAEQNVAFPLKRRGVPRGEQAERVREALAMVKLEPQARRYPRELSGGQQQRVALARALVYRPRALLMDEPLGALDKKLRDWLQLEIKRLHEALGITFIYVTHDQEEALVLSDRIAVFNDGRIEQLGTADELYERPRTLFVAEFLGESNPFTGTVSVDGDGWQVDAEGYRLRAPEPANGLGAGATGTLVIRPERMRISRAGSEPGAGDNVVRGRVAEVIYLGAARRARVELERGGSASVREPTAGYPPIEVGDEVELCWSPAHSTLLPHQQVDLEAEFQAM